MELEEIKRKIRITDATNLPTKAHVPESVIHKPFATIETTVLQ